MTKASHPANLPSSEIRLRTLVVVSGDAHEELKEIAHGCVTRHHSHHYLGFAATPWGLFEKEAPPRVKPLLYVYRVILTGIHLMRTGLVEANLLTLNDEFRLPYVADLVDRKVHGTEQGKLEAAERNFHFAEYKRLIAALEDAAAASTLQAEPSSRNALNDLLVRVRLGP